MSDRTEGRVIFLDRLRGVSRRHSIPVGNGRRPERIVRVRKYISGSCFISRFRNEKIIFESK